MNDLRRMPLLDFFGVLLGAARASAQHQARCSESSMSSPGAESAKTEITERPARS
jgi:hypothetical protein